MSKLPLAGVSLLVALSTGNIGRCDAPYAAVWTRQIDVDSSSYVYGSSVAADELGNIFVAAIIYLPDPNVVNLDAVISKYNAFGVQQWTRRIATSGLELDIVYGVGADGAGNAYVTGLTEGSLDGANAGGEDAFVRKYDSSGNVQWTKQFGTTANDSAYDIATDKSGGIYIGGERNSVERVYPSGNPDGNPFIAKLDATSGNIILIDGPPTPGRYRAVTVDSTGTLYALGTGSATFGGTQYPSAPLLGKYWGIGGAYNTEETWWTAGGPGTADLSVDGLGNVYTLGLIVPNGEYAYLSKLRFDPASDWQTQWVRQVGSAHSAGSDRPGAVAVDGAGNIFVTGTQDNDVFLREYNPAGDLLWSRVFGTSRFDSSYGISLDGSGNVYVSGSSTGYEGVSYAWVTRFSPSYPGDFNSDGIVDAADYVVWRKGLGTKYTQNDFAIWRANVGGMVSPAVPLVGDFNGDGVVDGADYLVWRKNGGTQTDFDKWRAYFGESLVGNGSSSSLDRTNILTSVPEPASAWLAAGVAFCLAPAFRRRAREERRLSAIIVLQ